MLLILIGQFESSSRVMTESFARIKYGLAAWLRESFGSFSPFFWFG